MNPMAIVLALITSIGHALDSFFVRKGLIESPFPMAAAYITLSINFAFFTVLSFGPLADGPSIPLITAKEISDMWIFEGYKTKIFKKGDNNISS